MPKKKEQKETLFLKLKIVSTKIYNEISEEFPFRSGIRQLSTHYLFNTILETLAYNKKNISIQNRNEKIPSPLRKLSLFVHEINIYTGNTKESTNF